MCVCVRLFCVKERVKKKPKAGEGETTKRRMSSQYRHSYTQKSHKLTHTHSVYFRAVPSSQWSGPTHKEPGPKIRITFDTASRLYTQKRTQRERERQRQRERDQERERKRVTERERLHRQLLRSPVHICTQEILFFTKETRCLQACLYRLCTGKAHHPHPSPPPLQDLLMLNFFYRSSFENASVFLWLNIFLSPSGS